MAHGQVLFRNLEKEDALKIADSSMQVLLALLMSSHHASNVIEDALLCISALIEGRAIPTLLLQSPLVQLWR